MLDYFQSFEGGKSNMVIATFLYMIGYLKWKWEHEKKEEVITEKC